MNIFLKKTSILNPFVYKKGKGRRKGRRKGIAKIIDGRRISYHGEGKN